MGYDIACSHMATVNMSSIGEKARTRRLLLAVNAFHGHAHNLLCQLRNHPLYIPGLGLEDLETCERVFSASNAVARVVRYSSYFHWLQYIDLHYRQWDEDKYFELSKSLFVFPSC
jgi:Kyakuja-Dileera-Zisupton transposase